MMLYLASTSPRRFTLMRRLGLPFRALRPLAVEATGRTGQPGRQAADNAKAKALSILPVPGRGLVVGVDTVVALDSAVLGKPSSEADARRMLGLLSGRTHVVVTGVAVVRMPGRVAFLSTETTCVTFARLSRNEIEDYVRTTEPHDKAGAYAIQGAGARFVRRVSGSYLNVVGLPVYRLLGLLRRAGMPLAPSLTA